MVPEGDRPEGTEGRYDADETSDAYGWHVILSVESSSRHGLLLGFGLKEGSRFARHRDTRVAEWACRSPAADQRSFARLMRRGYYAGPFLNRS